MARGLKVEKKRETASPVTQAQARCDAVNSAKINPMREASSTMGGSVDDGMSDRRAARSGARESLLHLHLLYFVFHLLLFQKPVFASISRAFRASRAYTQR